MAHFLLKYSYSNVMIYLIYFNTLTSRTRLLYLNTHYTQSVRNFNYYVKLKGTKCLSRASRKMGGGGGGNIFFFFLNGFFDSTSYEASERPTKLQGSYKITNLPY
uniref:Uncharacterized protein n=1 Tax=Cacopsylla melanoneura TaxID=428564 RepID=A0A8D9A008_9HEMI